jgi:predicted transposase/invertase (TIGR01784 family)
MKYDEGIRKYRDTICVMDYAIEKGLKEGFDKGMAKGMAEGMAEGIAKATIANALSLKKNGVPVEIIANSLGLSIDEVRKL